MAAPGELRHLPLDRQHHSTAGRGVARKRRAAAVALPTLLIATLALLSGCGGDDHDEAVAAASGGNYRAADLVPDLKSHGYTVLEEGRDPIAPDELDTYRALYGKSGGSAQNVIVIAYVQADEDAAGGQFSQVAEAYGNMPAAALLAGPQAGGSATGPAVNRPIDDGPDLGDEHAWFRTGQADGSGNHVWSDIYRSGRAVVIVQVLNGDVDTANEMREAVAGAALAPAQSP